MRLVKLAIISFVFIFGVITLISLLIPSEIRISRAIDLDTDRPAVLDLIAHKEKWPLWHPAYGQGNDSLQAKWVEETSWKKLVQNDTMVVIALQPKGKKTIINGWQLYRHNHSASPTLQWYMDFHLSWYPWQKFSSLFYEGTYGKMMEVGLNNLKESARLR
jgi:hypothetical protein